MVADLPRLPPLPLTLPELDSFKVVKEAAPEQEKEGEAGLPIMILLCFALILQGFPLFALAASLADVGLGWVELPEIWQVILALESLYFVGAQVSTRVQYTAEPQMSRLERLASWRRCLQDPTISAEEFIKGWFYERQPDGSLSFPEVHTLKRDDVLEWISWSIFNANPHTLDEEHHRELERALEYLQTRISLDRQAKQPRLSLWPQASDPHRGPQPKAEQPQAEPHRFRFEAGSSSKVQSKRLNLEPPARNIRPRPLFYYAITDVILGQLVTPSLMSMHGFRKHHIDRLTYWYRPASGNASSSSGTPLVFVHGVGLGPLPYIGFISDMYTNTDAPTLVLEIPWVSQRLSGGEAPNAQQTVDAISSALDRHKIKAATFVGHSLGSVYLSWVARMKPQLLASAVFIDPIVFMLHHYKVADSFLYDSSNDPLSTVEKYFIKSEHRIVSYFHRHFFWYNNNLWADSLEFPTTVVLSGRDSIVPVDQVRQYFRSNPWVRLMVLPEANHGEFIANPSFRNEVLEQVRSQQRAGWRRAGVTPPLVSELQTRLSALPDGIGGLKDGIGGLKDGIGGLKDGIGGVKKGIGGLTEGIGGRKEVIGGRREVIGGRKEAIGGLKDGIDGAKKGIGALTVSIGGLTVSISGLSVAIGGLKESIVALSFARVGGDSAKAQVNGMDEMQP